jgi:hypothetical protein
MRGQAWKLGSAWKWGPQPVNAWKWGSGLHYCMSIEVGVRPALMHVHGCREQTWKNAYFYKCSNTGLPHPADLVVMHAQNKGVTQNKNRTTGSGLKQNNGVRPVLMHIEHRRRARVNAYLPIGIYTGLPLSAWAPTFPAQPLFGFGSSRACSAIAWPAVRKGPAKLMELATMSHRDARTLSHGVAALGAPVTRKPGMRQELKRAQNACMQA